MTHVSYPKLFATVALSTALSAGCLGSAVTNGDNDDTDAGVNGDGPNGTTGGKADMAVDVHADFDANVRGLLLGDCGSCHAMASNGVGPGFLSSNPDVFTTVISYPGLIGPTCDTSRILTKDAHVGPSYHMTSSYTPSADLQAHATTICNWIKEYNAAGGFAGATGQDLSIKPRIEPFVPAVGNKSIDLGALDPKFAGASISFDIAMVGSTQLKLSNITLKGSATVGVHVVTPVFATYNAADTNVAVDIDYDYLSKDFVAGPGVTTVFSPSLTIFAYTSGQMINVSFNTLEDSAGAPDMAGGAITTCKDLNAFNALMPNFTTALPGMANNCSNAACHGQSGGTGGLNLNGIAANNQAVCNSVLNNTVLASPGNSPIYLHPTDGTSHTGGKITAGQARTDWLTAVTTFANAEK